MTSGYKFNFIDSWNHYQLKKEIITLYGYKCAYCGKREGKFEIHHITPRHILTDDSPQNLCFLHSKCHDKIHISVKSEFEFEKRMKNLNGDKQ